MAQDAAINGAYTAPGMDATGVAAPTPTIWDLSRWEHEIRAASKITQAIMLRSKPRHDRAGNGFRDGWPEHPDDINNYPFKFTNSFTPALAYTNPRIRILSRKGMALAGVVAAIGLAVNAWSVDANVQKPLTEAAYDLCFDYGVWCIGLEEYADPHGTQALKMRGELPPDAPDTADKVYVSTVLPNRFIMDPRTSDPDEAAWTGHYDIKDREKLASELEASGAPPETVARIRTVSGNSGVNKLRQDVNVDPMTGEDLARNEIVTLYVWHREEGLQHYFAFTGEPGTGNIVEIDEPQPFIGHKNGPHVVVGVYRLRGQAFPYAPLAATDQVLDESNAHRAQMRDDARGSKNIMAVRNPADAEAINSSPSNAAVALNDLSDKPVIPVKIGEVNETNRQAAIDADAELDALTGISQAAQGQLGASNNATEVAESSQRQNTRIEKVRMEFRARVVEMYRRVIDLFLKNDSVRQFVKVTTPQGEKDGLVMGGPSDDGTMLDVDDLALEIVPYSMEYVGDQQQRALAQEMFQNTIALVQAAEQWPVGVNWREIGDRMFDAMNQPEGTKGLIDFGAVAQYAQVKAAMAMEAEGGGGGPGVATGGGGGGSGKGQKPAPSVTQSVRSGAAKMGAQTKGEA